MYDIEMVSDLLLQQSKNMNYINESSTNHLSDTLYRQSINIDTVCTITPPPPPLLQQQQQQQHERNTMIGIGTSPLIKIRSLRKRIPQRGRYYTEDYALPNYCVAPKCDTMLYMDPSVQAPSPPSLSFSSPRSTITATANSSRFLRCRILNTIRHHNISTKHIIIDNDIDGSYNDDARSSQSYDIPSSLDEDESAKQDQHERIQSMSLQNASDIQSLTDCIEQLHLIPTPIAPQTTDSRTAMCTPICYQMTTNENPFEMVITEPPTNIEPMNENNDDCSTTSTTSSDISSISNDSAKRINHEPIHTNVPLFPPLEIRCHRLSRKFGCLRNTTYNEAKVSMSQGKKVPSTSAATNETWYNSWVANADPLTPPLTQAASTPRNSRPPHIQTFPDTSHTHSVLFRLDAPKNNIARRREVPIRHLDTVHGDVSLSPIYCKSVFKPIREKSSDEDEGEEDGSLSPILFLTSQARVDREIPVLMTSTFKPKHVMRSKTTGAIVNEHVTSRDDIFRKRPSQQHPPQLSRNTRMIPRRQFQRTLILSSNGTTIRKPMTIQVPSKSLPTGQPTNLRRGSVLSSTIFGRNGTGSSTDDKNGTIVDDYSNDPLLRNIPRRRVSQANKSVFSFGSIVGQSTVSSSSSFFFTTAPRSFHGADSSVSKPSATSKLSSMEMKSTSSSHECDGVVPKQRTKPTPFHKNEMNFYWKQTKKRLFTPSSKVVEKPNSITSLQRNTSGCLA